jgi:RNA polymerase sigma-70 factor (ECF subfamily)
MPMSDPEVRQLLERLGDSGPDALGTLFALYQERLRRMVNLRLDPRLKGRVSPSDVVQETFIDAMKRLGHFLDKPGMSFFLWLRLVADQRLIEVHRQHLGARMRDAGQEVSMERGVGAAASSICLADHLAGAFTSPSLAAIRGELLAQLEAALDGMDPIDREVLALRHFEELSNGEAAEVLGIDKSAASKRYIRALTRLKDILGRLPGFATASGA